MSRFLFAQTLRRLTLAFSCGVIALSLGCQKPEPIVQYKVPTKLPEQLQPEKNRMLAAIVPLGKKVWFFKVTGPESAIVEIESNFQTFVTNIQFDGGKPVLKDLPTGWRRGGEKVMRFASIDVMTKADTKDSKQLDISISNLGRPPVAEAWDGYVAMNVNRWRGQLGVDKSQDKWAGAKPLEVAAADGPSAWFDMLGDANSSGTMSPPFASRAPFAGGPSSVVPATGGQRAPATGTPASTATDSRLKFELPDGWRAGRKSSMRWAAFNVGPEDSPAEVTVMPAGGDLRGNVARWIGQVLGQSPGDKVVDKALEDAKKLDVSDRPAQRFVLTDPDNDSGTAIDATIVPMEGGRSMFIKMTGPIDTINDHSEELGTFLELLKF